MTYRSQSNLDAVLNPVVLLAEVPEVPVLKFETLEFDSREVRLHFAKSFAVYSSGQAIIEDD